jgi:hypothetical protein
MDGWMIHRQRRRQKTKKKSQSIGCDVMANAAVVMWWRYGIIE